MCGWHPDVKSGATTNAWSCAIYHALYCEGYPRLRTASIFIKSRFFMHVLFYFKGVHEIASLSCYFLIMQKVKKNTIFFQTNWEWYFCSTIIILVWFNSVLNLFKIFYHKILWFQCWLTLYGPAHQYICSQSSGFAIFVPGKPLPEFTNSYLT